MIIRQTLNFAAHLAAGMAFGALAVAALSACAKARNNASRSSLNSDDDLGTWEGSATSNST